jgi:hypothetical protein
MAQGRSICIYGPSGSGKTAAAGACLHGGGVVVFTRDAAESIETVYGIKPAKVIVCNKLPESLKALREMKDLPFVLLDDMHYPITKYADGSPDFWKAIDKSLLALAELSGERGERGQSTLFTANEQPPRTSSGKAVRGGPMLPGQGPEKFCGLLHTVARMVTSETGDGDDESYPGWQWWLDFGSDPTNYVARSRGLALPIKRFPPFLPEILRATGVTVDLPAVDNNIALINKMVAAMAEPYASADFDGLRDVYRPLYAKLRTKRDSAFARTIVMAALTRTALEFADTVIP